MFKLGDKVKIRDIEAVKKDPLLEKEGLAILEESKFIGEVTKIEDDIYFVGFKNEKGWLTQGYKTEQLERVE